MEHAELYYSIVKEGNLDQLHSIVSEQLDGIGYKVVKIEICRKNDFRYISCQIKTEEVFSAQMIGFFVEITSIIPGYEKPYYYLPVVVFCCDYDDRIMGFIDRELSLEHELLHIKDMLELIKQYPDYPEKSYRYGINSITDVKDLSKSIDLEMFKIFFVEPPAMRCDFDKGEFCILIPFDDKAEKVIRYECDSRDEYVGISIDSYLMRIRRNYKVKFENNEEASKMVDEEIDRALTCYGTGVFGRDPINGLTELRKKTAIKLLIAILKGHFV